MILAAVDDLMFASRISSAARAAEVEVRFVRSPDETAEQARQLKPAFVILDLNARKPDPMATLTRLKDDPALESIPVVGFVSHVDADAIAAARAAGIDQVLARSAFVARLPKLLELAR